MPALLALAGAASPAQAVEPPAPKVGLWQIDTTIADDTRPPRRIKLCIGRDTVSLLTKLDGTPGRQNDCNTTSMQVQGARVTTDASCQIKSSVVSTHTVTTYDSSTELHSETHARYKPPLFGKRDGTTRREAKWLGECASSMRPGDVMLENGMKMNVLDLAGVN